MLPTTDSLSKIFLIERSQVQIVPKSKKQSLTLWEKTR